MKKLPWKRLPLRKPDSAMEAKPYYEAYDDRYRQVHGEDLQWFSDAPSAIVGQVLKLYGFSADASVLELGCGEGRDARFLLQNGFQLTATDISPEAIRYCRINNPQFAEHFQILDCVTGKLDTKFDFIYAVAVVHMLVEDVHRAGFYTFFREHLAENGIGLICTMGDGSMERKSDISTAFDLQQRTHPISGKSLFLAGTSCRMVAWDTFLREITENGLTPVEHGLTALEPDFPLMMYAIVKKS